MIADDRERDRFGQLTASYSSQPWENQDPVLHLSQTDLEDREFCEFTACMLAPGSMIIETRAWPIDFSTGQTESRPNVALLLDALREVDLGLRITDHRLWSGNEWWHWHYVATCDDVRAHWPSSMTAEDLIDRRMEELDDESRRRIR